MEKKALREFEINLYQLENKLHTFDFNVQSDFFSSFENSFIENGTASVKLELDKSETMMQLLFHIKGQIELTCDVSVRKFWHEVTIDRKVILKFGNEEEELSEDVKVIPFDTQKINVAFNIYEFFTLEIPMKKVHPDLVNEERPDFVYSSETEPEEKEETIDPRWEVLKNLKNK